MLNWAELVSLNMQLQNGEECFTLSTLFCYWLSFFQMISSAPRGNLRELWYLILNDADFLLMHKVRSVNIYRTVKNQFILKHTSKQVQLVMYITFPYSFVLLCFSDYQFIKCLHTAEISGGVPGCVSNRGSNWAKTLGMCGALWCTLIAITQQNTKVLEGVQAPSKKDSVSLAGRKIFWIPILRALLKI